ncbi:MAG TPA: hypothetical protein VFB75_23555 [Burkholderiales bacterium]|nr:hypothetical protein [Burkholderiales bacterium]
MLPPVDRTTEWFVPRFGPRRFRVFVGLLFLPYTGMVLAYTVIGAMLAPHIYWDRVAAMLLIYFLALGIGAHAFDALGSRSVKPWGNVFSVRQLWLLGGVSSAVAYAIGAYYMIFFVPLLWPIAIAEGFFLLAYNLEWFDGSFHTDGYFALSWGALPVLGGYVMQTNALSVSAVILSGAAALFSLVEIRASRPYKALKRSRDAAAGPGLEPLESILKCISGGVLLLGVALAIVRWNG